MPIGLLGAAAIGAGIKGVTSIVKAIKGGADKKRGKKEMESALDNIKYTRPEEYAQITNLLKQRETSIPTQREMAEERVKRGTTAGISQVRQLADSPVAALTAHGGLKARETQAIADLEMQFEQKRDEAIMGQVGGLQMGAEYSEKEEYWNETYKNMVKANMGASRMSGGNDMMWSGIEGVASSGMDYFGTKYLASKLNPGSTPTYDPSAVSSGMTSMTK